MKRRKWWIIGLGLALLVSCVIAWRSSGRQPFRFMEGARRTWFHIQYGPGGACVVEDFELDKPVSAIRPIADAELLPLGFRRNDLPFYSAGSVDYERPWPGHPEYSQHITLYAEGDRTSIGTTRAPTLVDHVSWFFIRLVPRRP